MNHKEMENDSWKRKGSYSFHCDNDVSMLMDDFYNFSFAPRIVMGISSFEFELLNYRLKKG